ncbi:AI-2E family transporter [Sphingobium sp. H39-3-25]|uniref:AI-2E family transporter n=1 Tax=Sphingobium arseniciresistens TaxID=3030834 RepID=UPI0023B8891D|nr:AI-2E family transporter [Sphingobium arseniciresistens]
MSTVHRSEDAGFLALIVIVSLAFAWIVQPLFGATLWAVIAAILFMPLYDRLLKKMPGRRNLAASLTLLVIVALAVVPALLLMAFLLQEAAALYTHLQDGTIDLNAMFVAVQRHLPSWLGSLLERSGLTDLEAVRVRLGAGIASSFRTLTAQALSVGQSAFGFLVALGVMLYVTFFLLRDGRALASRVERAIPLRPDLRSALLFRFTTVIRATIKGSLVVAIVQGAIGGTIFWALDIRGALLWGVAMALFSLLPAVGTGIVWVPVAIYLLATGAIWQGVVLVLCGLFVIGMVDNLLRPILVGRDARIPDYVVLVSTLGGLEVMGFNGLVIGPVIAALFLATWDVFGRTEPEQASGGH